MPKAEPTYNFYDNDHPAKVEARLKQWISRRVNSDAVVSFYVGQTNEPEVRLAKHQATMKAAKVTPWDEMHVIYGNQSLGFVTDVENALIKHLKNHPKWEECGFNYAGARYDGSGEFYVYVLVDHGATSPLVNKTPDWHFLYRETRKSAPKALRDEPVTDAFKKAIRNEETGRTAEALYVGFTNDPARRFREHQDEDRTTYSGWPWEQMLVIYATPSLDHAVAVESELIDHALRYYRAKCRNTSRGRLHEGRLPYSYVYYLEER